ncbi:MAG TPA: nodulation protein NfeD [Dehalococcoidales bacterium]|nr:nodulation protein NfeD [Dehalococcoidales bacterium]
MSRVIFRTLGLVFFLALLVGALLPVVTRGANQSIHILHVEGTIVPVMADYIERGIEKAEDENALACIIELDTPGGLLDSTEEIVQTIMNADVPVIVYVNPKGAWAASAGTFITLSAHIAVMTPGTTIGAAHPVSGSGEEIPEDQMKKIVEFSAKWMMAIAQERGRNIEEAELAVTESKSFTDVDALEANIIDLRANTLDELIALIDGWEVTLANGLEVTIDTSSYAITRNEMSLVEGFLHAISDPNIAYILLSLGSIGIIAEIYSPGTFFPGIIGAISLLLAFYSLGVLDANLGGILLIILAFGLFIGEVLTSTFGIFTAGGITALVLGSLILFPETGALFQVNPWLIAAVAIIVAVVFAFVITRIVRTHRRQAYTGREELAGKTALAKTALEPEGIVLFKGERWTAVVEKGKVKAGEEVTITRVDGLKLYVTRKSTRGK